MNTAQWACQSSNFELQTLWWKWNGFLEKASPLRIVLKIAAKFNSIQITHSTGIILHEYIGIDIDMKWVYLKKVRWANQYRTIDFSLITSHRNTVQSSSFPFANEAQIEWCKRQWNYSNEAGMNRHSPEESISVSY